MFTRGNRGTQSARRCFGEWALLCAVIEVGEVLYLRAVIGCGSGVFTRRNWVCKAHDVVGWSAAIR